MTQKYALVVRTVHAGASIRNAQGELVVENAEEAQNHLNSSYLSHGYEVKEVSFSSLGTQLPGQFTFAWHLVKEVEDKKK